MPILRRAGVSAAALALFATLLSGRGSAFGPPAGNAPREILSGSKVTISACQSIDLPAPLGKAYEVTWSAWGSASGHFKGAFIGRGAMIDYASGSRAGASLNGTIQIASGADTYSVSINSSIPTFSCPAVPSLKVPISVQYQVVYLMGMWALQTGAGSLTAFQSNKFGLTLQ
jgi:hypothetical protein